MFNVFQYPFFLAMTIKKKFQTKYKLPTLNWIALKPNQVKGTIFSELEDDKLYSVRTFLFLLIVLLINFLYSLVYMMILKIFDMCKFYNHVQTIYYDKFYVITMGCTVITCSILIVLLNNSMCVYIIITFPSTLKN